MNKKIPYSGYWTMFCRIYLCFVKIKKPYKLCYLNRILILLRINLKTQNEINMKKLILSLAVVTIATMTANAQVGFGFKAGLNLATFSGSDASNITGKAMQAGANFGGMVQIPVSGRFSVNPELVFSMQGAKFDGGSDNLNYLNIPVLAHFATASGFFVEAGPQIGFLLSAKEKATGGGSTDIKEFLQSTDFAAALGAGFQSRSGFGGNARVNLGLSSIDKGTPKAKINNTVIQICVFYMLNAKGGKE